ncbi:MAG: M23 family metallopeptidase [Candidatus Moraniibacteriota bacterium]|nr:MAG: M23 family metallopeptidase [Candidatus Moranbacteria bacterium]
MMHGLGKDAYAIADGKVVYISYDDGDGKKWGVGNCALVIEHRTTESMVFSAVYGHLKCSSLPAKYAEVEGGVSIGKIGHWDYGDHLHFAIHDGPFRTMAKSGWGMMANSEWRTPCEGNSTCTNTFTNPVAFIQTHFAFNPSTEKQVACQGHVCWSPKTVACETATMWYKGLSDPVVRAGIPWMFEVGREICDDLHPMFNAVAAAEDPGEVLPEGSLWWNFMRFIHKMLGETASYRYLFS